MPSKSTIGHDAPNSAATSQRGEPTPDGPTDGGRLRRPELATYLNDHLAGAEAGRRLAARLARSLDGELKGVEVEIERDYDRLLRLLDALEIGRSRVKQAAGMATEALSRVKLRLGSAGVRDLGPLLGLEAMAVGVAGKLRLWRSLESIASSDPRLDAEELRALAARAEAQLDTIEQLRLQAARRCLAGSR
jgi:hypothetical protein